MPKIHPLPSEEEKTLIERHYTSKQLSKRLGISPSFLGKLRLMGAGPKYIKFGHRSILYPESEVEKYLNKRKRSSTSDTGDHHD